MLIQVQQNKKERKEEIVVGIDLGTTYSLIATGHGEIIVFDESATNPFLMPSVVSYGDAECFVGKEALLNPSKSGILGSTKRLIKEPNQYIWNKKSPIDVAYEILKHLVAQAEKSTNSKITKGVITVPSYFDDTARNATMMAAQMAGLDVMRIINEPTAAALAYGLDKGHEGIYLVYDLGGGTFDVSILKMSKGVFQVLATVGDLELGGDDIDDSIVKFWYQKGHTDLLKLKKYARIAKETLAQKEIWQKDELSLSRKELYCISDLFIKSTLKILDSAIEEAKVSRNDIKGIILVGGSTKLWGLKVRIQSLFDVPVYVDIDPDLAVVKGAAIQAQALYYGGEHILLDVNSLSLGLEIMGGVVEKIIHRNTALPALVKQTFTTYEDGQTAIRFHVVQGEREMAKDCRSLAEFTLSNLPAMRAGCLLVDVTFEINIDGILKITAYEKISQKKIDIEIKPSYGLTEEVVMQMIYDAGCNAKWDMTQRMLSEKTMEAGKLCKVARTCINDPGSELTLQEIRTIENLIEELEDMARSKESSMEISETLCKEGENSKDIEELERKIENLSESLRPAIEKRLRAGLKKHCVGQKINA